MGVSVGRGIAVLVDIGATVGKGMDVRVDTGVSVGRGVDVSVGMGVSVGRVVGAVGVLVRVGRDVDVGNGDGKLEILLGTYNSCPTQMDKEVSRQLASRSSATVTPAA